MLLSVTSVRCSIKEMYKEIALSHTTEIPKISVHIYVLVTFISTVSIALVLLLMFVNIKYRNNRALKMSSPNLNLLILFGSCLTMISPTVVGASALTQSDPKQYLNQMWRFVRIGEWIGSIGFTLTLGSMVAKTWRVTYIFLRPPSANKNKIKDEHLIGMVCGLTLFHIILLAMWTTLDKSECKIVSLVSTPDLPEIFAETVKHNKTTSGNSMKASLMCGTQATMYWLAGFCLYKVVVVCLLLYMAWETRKVTIQPIDDASGYLLTSVIFLLSMCFGILGTALSSGNPSILFGVTSLSVLLPAVSAIGLHFWSKVAMLLVKTTTVSKEVTQFLKSSFNDSGSKDKEHLEIENALLKTELRECRKLVESVKSQLKWKESISTNIVAKQISATYHERTKSSAETLYGFQTNFKFRRCMSDTVLDISPQLRKFKSASLRENTIRQQEQQHISSDVFESSAKPTVTVTDCGLGCYYYSGSDTDSDESSNMDVSENLRRDWLKHHVQVICSEYSAGQPLNMSVPTPRGSYHNYSRFSGDIGSSYPLQMRFVSAESLGSSSSDWSGLYESFPRFPSWYITGTGATLV